MIRAGALVADQHTDVCPNCGGDGRIVLEQIHGRTAAEPYVYGDCYACRGAGVVDADAVGHCEQPGCEYGPFWVDEGCNHGPEQLCPDHKNPRCPDCLDAVRVQGSAGVTGGGWS